MSHPLVKPICGNQAPARFQRITERGLCAETETKDWHRRANGFVHAQWHAYAPNGLKLPDHRGQEEACNEMMSHSVRNLGTAIMTGEEIDHLEETLHNAFMRMLDRKMGLSVKDLSRRYAMGGHA